MADATYIDVTTNKIVHLPMIDEHEMVTINEKKVTIGAIGTIIQGEENSQLIEFQMDRFYDEIDLKDKDIYILFRVKTGKVYKVPVVNLMYSDENIRFSWLLDEHATLYSGIVTACVKIESAKYILKSTNFNVPVVESLNEYEEEGTTETWVTTIENKINALENMGNFTNVFVGTQAEFTTALSEGKILENTLVIIL